MDECESFGELEEGVPDECFRDGGVHELVVVSLDERGEVTAVAVVEVELGLNGADECRT